MEELRRSVNDILRDQGKAQGRLSDVEGNVKELQEFKSRISADFYGVAGSEVLGVRDMVRDIYTRSDERDKISKSLRLWIQIAVGLMVLLTALMGFKAVREAVSYFVPPPIRKSNSPVEAKKSNRGTLGADIPFNEEAYLGN